MSISQPVRCLLSKPSVFSKPVRRTLHATSSLQARRRPRYNSVKADDLSLLEKIDAGVIDPDRLDAKTRQRLSKTVGTTWEDLSQEDLDQVNNSAKELFPSRTDSEEATLSKKYTPSQIAAIKAAEEGIDPRDFVTQGDPRDDTARLKYKDDDLTEIDYVVDKKVKKTGWPLLEGDEIRPHSKQELYSKLAEFIVETGEKYTNVSGIFNPDEAPPEVLDQLEVDWLKFTENPRTLFYAPNEEAYKMMEDPARDTLAPELPKIDDKIVQQTVQTADEEEVDLGMKQVEQRMGWTFDDIRRIRTKVLVVRRVVNQTSMGKVASMYYLTVAGNGNGLMGIGEGKSTEPDQGRRQSMLRAIRNMRPIHRYEDRTIYGEVRGKVGATELVMNAKHPGFGNRAMHLIFEMTRAAGIDDLHARVYRARNPMNVCKATLQALLKQKLPEDIARGRGRKMVDVRKVYYGGLTPG